jgi:hypothetical protein
MKSKSKLHGIMRDPIVNEMYDVRSREWLTSVFIQEGEDLLSHTHTLKIVVKHMESFLITDYQDSTVKWDEDLRRIDGLFYRKEQQESDLTNNYFLLKEVLIEVSDDRLSDFRIKELRDQNEYFEEQNIRLHNTISKLMTDIDELKEKRKIQK